MITGVMYNINDLVHSKGKFYLKELPARGSLIINDIGVTYFVMRSMFAVNYPSNSHYYFEQIICKYPRNEGEPFIPYLLVGSILLPSLWESMIEGKGFYPFIEATINIEGSKKYSLGENTYLPYGHLRRNDMIKINEDECAPITNLIINENQLKVDLAAPRPINRTFRVDVQLPKDYY